SHGTASAADQIAAFTDGFALGTILYNVAVGFRLIGRAGELAAGKAGFSEAGGELRAGGAIEKGLARKTGLAAEPSYDIPEGTARFFARMDRDAYYSDAGFASRGFIRGTAPEEGIGPIYRAGQRGKDGWSWGAVRPNSVSQAKSLYRPLEQIGEPDTLF